MISWPSGERLLSAADDGILSLWDGASLQLLAKWQGHRSEACSVAWEPGGGRFVSASDGIV